MAYNYSFADNEIYSADDLNAITKRLVTSGIEDSFEDGVAYNVSRFNEQGKLLYTSGVVPETCTTLKVVPDGEGKVLINPGKAFFDDGAVIEIEAGGESLSYVAETKNYVYLKNDLLNSNVCYPCCTTDEPTGNYVLLAEIDELGEISDKRTYAKGRLPGYQSIADAVMYIKDKIQITLTSYNEGVGSKSFDIGPNSFTKILSQTWPDKEKDYPGKPYVGSNEYGAVGIYDIENEKYLSFKCTEAPFDSGGGDAHLSTGVCYISASIDRPNHISVKFSLEDGILTVDATIRTAAPLFDKDEIGKVVEADLNLILF